METGYIKFRDIDSNKPIVEVKIVDGTVWMTVNEIADLLGVYAATVNKHLKVIFKEDLLKEPNVTKEYRYSRNEKEEYIRTYYNLEVVIFLSFRIQSLYTKTFREWVLNAFREYSKEKKQHEIIVVFETNTGKTSLKTLN